jgi:hypothetical protein
MNLDELFEHAARVAEPDLPADVLGDVRRAQARHRRRQLIAVPVACITIAAALLVPTVLLEDDEPVPVSPITRITPTAPAPTTPAAAPEPTVLVGLSAGHAVRLDLSTGTRIDLGAARAVTLHEGKPWLSRSRASCDDTIVTPAASFDAHGEVPALEVSPDGRTLAFVRESGPASKDYPDMPCASRSLVLRDLGTGTERSWSADDGSIWGLTWSADSRRLAYTFNGCCGDYSPDVHDLDIAAAPGAAYDVLSPPVPTDGCTNDTPVFAGQTLLLLVKCFSQDGGPSDTYELRDATTGSLVVRLSSDIDAVRADASGQHLLAHAGAPGGSQGSLLAIRLRDHYQRQLSEAVSDPHW